VILSLSQPGGDKLVQAAGFVKPKEVPAAPTAASPSAAEQAMRTERDDLHAEIAGLKAANTRLHRDRPVRAPAQADGEPVAGRKVISNQLSVISCQFLVARQHGTEN
jgi:hypothetical protein